MGELLNKNSLTTFDLFLVDYRCAFKHTNIFSKKMVQKVLFNCKELVEEMIAVELKQAEYGSLMHDGWSKFGTHYVGLFAQYNRRVPQNIGKVKSTTLMPTNVLLAMRPMCGVAEEEDNDDKSCGKEIRNERRGMDEEATEFTAEVHENFFREVLKSYGVILEDWAVCQVSFFVVVL